MIISSACNAGSRVKSEWHGHGQSQMSFFALCLLVDIPVMQKDMLNAENVSFVNNRTPLTLKKCTNDPVF